MPPILRLPHEPVRLRVQEYTGAAFHVSGLLGDHPVIRDHMDELHIRNLSGDPISMAHIVKRLYTLRIHGRLRDKTLIHNTKLFIHISPVKLVPRERLHLIPVVRIDLTRLILVCDQVRV